MKKTTVMFRMLDSDWIPVNPHRTDYVPYKGSNQEELDFHGGKSVVFAIPTGSLQARIKDVDIQIHVIKEISKYFEVNPSQEQQNVGVALANVDCLFNGIIKELREREELKEYLNCFHKRQPISRSLKQTYQILDEDQQPTAATIGIYVRLSYLGKSVITEIERDLELRPMFYAQEETNEKSPYQCRELKQSELESGCWGSNTFLPPVRANQLICYCDKWGVIDDTDDKSGKKQDDDKKKTGKGSRDSETGERVKKGGRNSSGDLSQMRPSIEVKKGVDGGTKSKKSTRTSKSADEKGRKAKSDNNKVSETLETSGSELQIGQKQRTTSKDKRVKKDFRREGKEDFRDRKTIEDKNGDSMVSNEYARMIEQMRKRRRGTVTIGIVDKKKNNCPEAIPSPQASTCPREAVSMTPQLCANFCSPCCYPRSYVCNPLPLSIPKIQIATN